MLVSSFDDAVIQLCKRDLVNDRSRVVFGRHASHPRLHDFYMSWPMYRDGPSHAVLRRQILVALSRVELRVRPLVDEYLGRCEIEDKDLGEFARAWHRELLGTNEDQQEKIIEDTGLVTGVFFGTRTSLEDFEEAEKAISRLLPWFRDQQFGKGLIAEMRAEDVPMPTQLSVVTDSLDPMGSAVAAIACDAATAPPARDANTIVDQALRCFPPFRYINRWSNELEEGVRIDLLACQQNASSSGKACSGPSLSFGFGLHSCPARAIALEMLPRVAEHVRDLGFRLVSRPTLEASNGQCRLSGVMLRRK